MTVTDEVILFDQSNVKVTTLQFIIANQGSYPLSALRSAEVGHWDPAAVTWLGLVAAVGVVIALIGIGELAGMPVGELSVRAPTEVAWTTILLGTALATIGGTLAMMVHLIWGRHIVRVETVSGESSIIFSSRGRKPVQGAVDAINKAIGCHASPMA